jgi:hypothetical protein
MNTLAVLFLAVTNTYSLPIGLLSALCFVESSHRVEVIHKDDGGAHSIGVCQIKVETARMVGFTGTEQELLNPKTNITYAAKYLKRQIDRYDGDLRKGVAAYNSGRYMENDSGWPKNNKYVTKVFKAWGEGK